MNGIYLIDDNQWRSVIDPDQVTLVHQQAADPAVDRRINVAIAELNFGIFYRCFIGFDHRLGGIGVGFDQIILFSGDVLFFHQLGITPHLFAQVLELRVIALHISFCLPESGFERTRIDSKELLSLFYVLPVLEMSFHENAGDLTLD